MSINCPNSVSGRYKYNVTGVSCADTWMDGCTDKNEITFNYTLCTDTMAYSGMNFSFRFLLFNISHCNYVLLHSLLYMIIGVSKVSFTMKNLFCSRSDYK